MKKLLVVFLMILFLAQGLLAQQQIMHPDIAETLRQSGKIYIVVAVILVIFAGMITYLALLDIRLTRLEKKIKTRNKN